MKTSYPNLEHNKFESTWILKEINRTSRNENNKN